MKRLGPVTRLTRIGGLGVVFSGSLVHSLHHFALRLTPGILRRGLLSAMLLSLLPAIARAQTIHGVVVDPGDRPVAGVVVLLLDAASNEAARSLSNERGEFRVAATSAGIYRVRTLRIGFRPLTSDVIALTVGQNVTQRLILASIPFLLDTIRSLGRMACRMVARDSAAATWAVWEQVRTALTAAQLTASGRAIGATTVSYDRTLDPRGRRVLAQTATVRSEVVTQPWRGIPPDSLRRFGYVVSEPDGMTSFRAPGLDALLSPVFLEDHCVRLVAAPDPTRLGIAFEPNADRKRVPEISGTLWLDRKTSELRSIEFRYVNVSRDVEDNAGGAVEFARMRNGAWVISRWNIRMPALVQRRANFSSRMEIGIGSIQVKGGELVLASTVASRGLDTLWSRPPLVLRGMVLDSVSGAPVRNARVTLAGTLLEGVTNSAGRFSIEAVMPGNYVVETRTPSLDAMNAINESPLVFTDSAHAIEIRVPTGDQIATQLCGIGQLDGPGIVVGRVTLRFDTLPQRGVAVVAEWIDFTMRNGTVEQTKRANDARTDASGSFRICGVPVNTALNLRATTDSAASAPVAVRIPAGLRFDRADLVLDRQIAAGATFTGIVLADSTRQSIANAEVSLPELSMGGLTNDKGEFRITDVPAGTHQLIVRRIGYGQLDTRISFAANQTVARTVVLSRIITLDSVVVAASGNATDNPLMEFEAHRKAGFGHFVTRAELAKKEGSTSAVLRQLPGMTLVNVRTRSYVSSNYVPRDQAGAITCFSQVYLDKTLMNIGEPTPGYDINELAPGRIEAIEWFASREQAPMEYNSRRVFCGVLIIHTRR